MDITHNLCNIDTSPFMLMNTAHKLYINVPQIWSKYADV